jgi:hypothetical protein
VKIVLDIPRPGQRAGRIGELIERLAQLGADGGCGTDRP